MKKVVIIGAGGVGGVVAHKCAQASDVFDDVLLASRTLSRCDKIAAEILEVQGKRIRTAAIDADDVAATTALLAREQPAVVINVALPAVRYNPRAEALIADALDEAVAELQRQLASADL